MLILFRLFSFIIYNFHMIYCSVWARAGSRQDSDFVLPSFPRTRPDQPSCEVLAGPGPSSSITDLSSLSSSSSSSSPSSPSSLSLLVSQQVSTTDVGPSHVNCFLSLHSYWSASITWSRAGLPLVDPAPATDVVRSMNMLHIT